MSDEYEVQDQPEVAGGEVGGAEPEPEYEPPQWLNESYSRPAPPAPAPVVQQAPPPRWEPPNYDTDKLLAEPSRVVDSHIRAYADNMASALLNQQREMQAMRQNLTKLHEHSIRGLERDARKSVSDAMRRFSKDPAMANKTVKNYVEGFLQARFQEARRRAHEDMDPEMLQGLTSSNFLDVTFDYAKREAGYKEGRPPQTTNPQGMPQRGGTGAPRAAGGPPLSAEEREFCRLRGISEEDYSMLKQEHAEWSSFA